MRLVLACVWAVLVVMPTHLAAQPSSHANGIDAVPAASPHFFTPDVLQPNQRRNSPDLKIGLRLGVSRSSYSNDRYLDNIAIDQGATEGESEVYTSAAGFGYSGGIDVEIPMSTGFSYVIGVAYDNVTFASSGGVLEPCEHPDLTIGQGKSVHEFSGSIDYLKVSAVAKLAFSSWYLIGGLAASHPFITTLRRTRTFESGCRFPGTGSSFLVESGEIPGVRPLHYAIRLGAGITYRLTDRLVFAPELTLDFGASAINKSPDSDLGIYAISATLRYDIR